MLKKILLIIGAIAILFWTNPAQAGTLAERLAAFPTWPNAQQLQTTGELTYPQWLAGEWAVTSTLVDRIAPLAPQIVPPSFQRSQSELDRPTTFRVRFGSTTTNVSAGISVNQKSPPSKILIDRVFNIEQIANTYLGANAIQKIRSFQTPEVVQVTELRDGTILTAKVTGYRSETPFDRLPATGSGRRKAAPDPDRFIATEIQQQLIAGQRSTANTIETLTSYHRLDPEHIQADQITATYLSPQDPSYFQAAGQPIILYRYQLTLKSVKQ
jgi:hypothetical protein